MAILKIKSNNSLKSFHFKSKEEIAPEEFVIIPAEGGGQLAKVLPESSIIKKQLENKILPEIMRKASPEYIKTYKDKEKKEKEAYDFC
jgi:cell fate regulator YaaT (PSP1 superfamily)